MTLLRSSATVGALTGVSRALGYVRDILMAAILGAGPIADAFFVVFRLPNLFRRLFAGGPLRAVFVPMLAERMAAGGRGAAGNFAGQILAVAIVVSVLLTSGLQLAMPWVMYALAPGFADDPERFDLAVTLGRIMLLYFLFVLLVLHLSGVLQTLGRFAAAAAMPILLNLFLILSVFVLAPLLETPAHGFAWGLAAAGVAQFACLLVACRRVGFPLKLPRPRLTPGVRRLLKAAAPAAIGAGVLQVNLLVDAAVASLLEPGAISYLYYAERVVRVPFGIVGVAVGTALLPLLSRQIGAGDQAGASGSMNRALEGVLLLILPGMAALLVISEPVVATLFERGSFTPDTTASTAAALVAYAAGLPAYALIGISRIGFFSRQDTTMPMRIALACIAGNLVLNLLLMEPLQHVGIALATSIASWLNAVLLFYFLVRRRHFAADSRLRRRILGIVAACLGMVAVLEGVSFMLGEAPATGEWARVAFLATLIGVGFVSFAGLALVFGAVRLRDLSAFRR